MRSLSLGRLVEGRLVPCGSAGSGLTEADALNLREAIDAGRTIVATIEFRGFTPAGELRHPVVRGWVPG